VTLPFRLLAIDIDGTLLNSQFHISAPDMAALRHIHGLGVHVAVCSGRRHLFAMTIVKQFGFDGWICSSNGAVIRSTQYKTLHTDFLPAKTAEEVVTFMADYRDGTVLTFDTEERGALALEMDTQIQMRTFQWFTKNQPYIERFTPLELCLRRGADPIQAMICGGVERVNQADARLTECPARRLIHVMKTEYAARDLSMLDIVNAGCSKGHALERLATHLKISRHEVVAIGDNNNDLEMLEYAGLPFAMANSTPDVLARGWPLTGSNDQSGVAQAIEQALGRKIPVEVGETK